MTHLSLALLGPIQITLDEQPLAGFDYAKVRALLVYLAVERDRGHQRDVIAELLWPDQGPQVARNSLRQALAKLRQTIRDQAADPPFLLITRETLQFNRAARFSLDIAEFEALAAAVARHRHDPAGACADCVAGWERMAALYRGPFLDQAVPRDSTGFEEWTHAKREWFERQGGAALANLSAAYEARGDAPQALRYARRSLELDPWNEATHRQIMRLLAQSDQRSAALAHYAHCRRVLAEELGVEPEDATIALYEHILTGKLSIENEELRKERPESFSILNSQFSIQATSFVGREQELAELGALLADPACRLITLLGPGGIGKTRLALRTAQVYGLIFAQGACWVPLAALAGPEHLAGTIARALDITLDETGDPQRQIVAALAGKELLLVLDNFEHLLDGSDLLVALLAGAPRLKLLVTSRERLHLQSEWLFDVPGLPYPDDRRPKVEDRRLKIEDSGSKSRDVPSSILYPPSPVVGGRRSAVEPEQFGAVRLFLERARQVRRGQELADEDRRAIVRICQSVEGMPLALELAAAASREQSYGAIAAGLAGALDILQAAFRDQPERHRSVRAAFEYSWRMLAAAQQQICMCLAVFRGSFSDQAAAAVAGAAPDALEALADRSLLRREADGRYALHELLRQFAAEKRASAGERQAPGRHLAYFLALAERAEPLLRSAEQQHWLALLERDHDNLRAALGWALGAGEHERAGRLAGALWRFWWIRGYGREGRHWLEQVAAVADLPVPVRAKALNGLGALVEEHGDLAQAAAWYEASLDLFRHLEDPAGISSALNNLGGTLYKQSDFSRAIACFSEVVAIDREIGDHYGMAVAMHNLAGAIYDSGGDIAEARRLLAESLELWDALGMKQGTATTLSSLGQLALIQGDNAAAARFFEESLVTLRELGDPRSASLSLTGLGRALHRQGDDAAALDAYHEALALRHELGDKLGIAECLEGLGEVALAQGAPARTMRLYGAAAAIRAAIGSPVLPVDQQAYDETLAAARAQLDLRQAEDLWAAGQALPIDAAVAFARGAS